nr:tail fiber assembly protein [Enterobacter quasiroggenkampii]
MPGAYDDSITLVAPSTPYDNWNGSEWVTDEKMQKNAQVKAAEQKKNALLAVAQSTISLWQTELQLDLISDEDKVKLKLWMHYIRDLQAIKTSEAPDVFWPEEPELA